MDQHEGIIEIIRIKNTGLYSETIGTLTARFVRYPGSQQLSLWLPENGWNYKGKYRILDLISQQVVDENSVADSLNGSILLTWDTLPWAPGEYRLEVEHPNGGKHILSIKKWPEGTFFPKDKIVEMPVATAQSPSLISALFPQTDRIQTVNDTMWKVYKDGHGNDIPNTDQILRDEANEELQRIVAKIADTSGPRLEYEGNFRGGNVIYVEGDLRLSFWHEMGGNGCKMYIDIPNETTWEQRTTTPLSHRDEIVQFIANTVRREQAPSWRYEIGKTEISFY